MPIIMATPGPKYSRQNGLSHKTTLNPTIFSPSEQIRYRGPNRKPFPSVYQIYTRNSGAPYASVWHMKNVTPAVSRSAPKTRRTGEIFGLVMIERKIDDEVTR